MKKNRIYASTYKEATISIPNSRLHNILKPGDSIDGRCSKIGISANFVGYRVTHVDHWGVYAVPTDRMLIGLKDNFTQAFIDKCKGHHKFKWCNITGMQLQDEVK